MSLTTLLQLGVIPAMLFLAAWWIVRRAGPPEGAGRRLLFFLLGVEILLALTVIISRRLLPADSRWGFQVSSLLAPAMAGGLALLLLNLRPWLGLKRGEKGLALGLAGSLVGLFLAFQSEDTGILGLAFMAGLVLAVAWAAARWATLPVILAVLALAALLPFNLLVGRSAELPAALQPVTFLFLYLLPGLIIGLAASLVATGLRRVSWAAGLRLGLAVVLLAALAIQIYWFSIWDQTSDGLGGIWFTTQGTVVAIGAGMLLAAARPTRLAGLLFAVLTPLLLYGAFRMGWDVSYHAITEARAARIAAALERFHARQGHYPQRLAELTPRDLLWVPGPVILQGEDWCYQAGAGGYRLGSFYREFFSLPLSLRIYAQAGAIPETAWDCDARLEELKARFDPPGFNRASLQNAPTPPAISQVSVPRQPIQPVVADAAILPGSWSPDGKTWTFSRLEGEQEDARPYFLVAASGEICRGEAIFPTGGTVGQRTAWLSDSRLLVLDGAGRPAILTPCRPGVEQPAAAFPELINGIPAAHPASGRMLLETEQAYWLLETKGFTARQIPEPAPTPFELHWDRFAWSPDGARLAISHLNEQDAQAGSTLYVLDAESLAVQIRLPLPDASDQSAPLVEWVSSHELLLHGEGDLKRVDLSRDPPHPVSVLSELFNLDLAYPTEMASMAAVLDPSGRGYYLAVRANHPRNQAIYLYHSETGRVETLHPEAGALLFFPGQEWTPLPPVADKPPERDQYDLYWIDATGRPPQSLTATGHLPRAYPMLWVNYLPEAGQLVFSSQQGVSLVSLASGELLRFWTLAAGSGISPYTRPAPDESGLVVVVDGIGLYWLPLSDE